MSLIPARGRPAKPLSLEVVRDLTLDDILRLSTEGTRNPASHAVVRLRTIHHRIAIAQAAGMAFSDIARVYDVTHARINQLQSDPGYLETLSFYTEQITEASVDAASRVQEKLTDIAEMSVDYIREKMEIEPEKISIADHQRILQMALDRTVAPPKATLPTAPVHFDVTFNMGGRDIRPDSVLPAPSPRGPTALVTDAEVEEIEPGIPP